MKLTVEQVQKTLARIDEALAENAAQRRRLNADRDRVRLSCPHPREFWQSWTDPGSGRKSHSCGICEEEL